MATLNVGIKVSAAVAASTTTSGTTLYTAPANGYAIISAVIGANTAGNTVELRVGGQNVLTVINVGTTAVDGSNGNKGTTQTDSTSGGPAISQQGIYVGPGQTVVATRTVGAGAMVAKIAGVAFVNTQ